MASYAPRESTVPALNGSVDEGHRTRPQALKFVPSNMLGCAWLRTRRGQGTERGSRMISTSGIGIVQSWLQSIIRGRSCVLSVACTQSYTSLFASQRDRGCAERYILDVAGGHALYTYGWTILPACCARISGYFNTSKHTCPNHRLWSWSSSL